MKTFFQQTILAGMITLGALPLVAQDYEQFQPKVPAPANTTPTLREPPLPVSAGGNDILVKKLKGVVFVTEPSQVSSTPPKVMGLQTNGIPVLQNEDFPAVIQPYLDQPVTMTSLNAMIKAVILYSRRHDRPVVDVIVPDQEITSGVVQLVYLEGRLGQVHAEGNRWFSSDSIESEVRQKPGEEISANLLLSDVSWINQNPFISTEAVFTPGAKLGLTNVVLETKDRFPVRFYSGYEDSGNAATGFDRYLAGFNWGDAFHLGQQLNYQYTTSGDGDSLRAHAGSYIIPLPWRHTLTFFGSYTDTKAVVPPLIGITGRSYQISGRYGIPLPTLTLGGVTYKHIFSAGFDYKYNNNALEFGGLPAGGTLYDIDQFVLSYNGALTDPYGQTTFDNQFYVSPGNWGGNNNDSAFNASHTGATSDYIYDTVTLQRLTRLPGDWSLLLRGTLQFSNGNLVPSEQLGFGGYDTIRGYDEREVNADEGYIFTAEIRTPNLSLGELCGWKDFNDQLQFLGFWDYGAGYNHDLLPGEPSEIPLSAVGGGLRYSINTYVSLRFDYGFQLLSTGFDNRHGSRSNLGVIVSY